MDNKLSSIPVYLGDIAYYKQIATAQEYVFCNTLNYTKKTNKNRTYILGANGILRLSIPILRYEHFNKLYTTTRISYAEHWQKDHWNSIVAAYRRSPFFEFYEDGLFSFYHSNFEFLYDFNCQLHHWLCKVLNLAIEKEHNATLINSNINDTTSCNPYLQVFSNKYDFVPNLSILDVLFNKGGKLTKEYLLIS